MSGIRPHDAVRNYSETLRGIYEARNIALLQNMRCWYMKEMITDTSNDGLGVCGGLGVVMEGRITGLVDVKIMPQGYIRFL